MIRSKSIWLILALSVWLAACQTPPPPIEVKIPVGKPSPDFMVSKWAMLPDWTMQDLAASWPAMQQSCRALKFKPVWLPICAAATKVGADDVAAQRSFYETWFTPYQVFNPDGTDTGLITGYYEPLLKGSRTRSKRFAYPIYSPPDDMLEVDMGDLYPQFRGQRVRGRLEGKRVVPYFNRAEIDAGLDPALKGHELFWVENPVELFFLQIQGSGRIELEDGTRVMIGYADQNGHGYASIGKKLIEMGELKPEEASMQGIKNWAEKNPERLFVLLGQNPSYVFFRVLPDSISAPLGALGVPLTNEYSIAVDQRTIPLGVPVFLATTQPNSTEPLNRLVFAQDTGGAIKGAVRADFFWGFGDYAAVRAGSMKQSGKMWVLFPRGGEPVLN
ncbi:murein transglycosylase A [Sideroxydans lithotrophicus]|uniref:peptidoglycan lytic exotransglycosylase n=1 Tax=Sideroxydans lithotrophicus (strain ES-1) TaxID=580332 RepID=D5CLD8_SIDLE|nr:murein transglycosylase A [Sideroxydans lithotrophicus]ADE10526.1 MltA domain protein [Sideroxydans lithotrophicus ES-1]